MERSRENGSQSAALNKLGEEFIESICASFEAKGAQVIRRVSEENPGLFCRSWQVSPARELEPNGSELDHLSPEELDRMLKIQMKILSKLNEA